jgi:RNA polymerase sigma-70 factor (family 1)
MHLNNVQVNIIELQRDVAIGRDQKAYRKLFIHYYTPLMRFATAIVRPNDAAEEIYCSVLLKLWDLEGALNNIDNLSVYLYIGIKNASLNYLAKYNKVRTVDIDSVDIDLLQQADTPEQSLLQSELQRTVQAAIRTLPAKCQLVYKLIKEDGFSYKQVAEILQISVNTVEGHMSTALSRLAKAMKPYLYPNRN